MWKDRLFRSVILLVIVASVMLIGCLLLRLAFVESTTSSPSEATTPQQIDTQPSDKAP